MPIIVKICCEDLYFKKMGPEEKTKQNKTISQVDNGY